MIPTHRTPTHPGEMLLEEFLLPLGLSQRDLADAIHVPYQRVNEIVTDIPLVKEVRNNYNEAIGISAIEIHSILNNANLLRIIYF